MDEIGRITPIEETMETLKICFDQKFGHIMLVHFSEQGQPLKASSDRTTEFVHCIKEMHKFHKAQDRECLKLLKPDGSGITIMMEEAKYPPTENWFHEYLKRTGWEEIGKNSFSREDTRLKTMGKEILVSSFSSEMTFFTPRNEVEASCLWYMLGISK